MWDLDLVDLDREADDERHDEGIARAGELALDGGLDDDPERRLDLAGLVLPVALEDAWLDRLELDHAELGAILHPDESVGRRADPLRGIAVVARAGNDVPVGVVALQLLDRDRLEQQAALHGAADGAVIELQGPALLDVEREGGAVGVDAEEGGRLAGGDVLVTRGEPLLARRDGDLLDHSGNLAWMSS